MLWLCIYLAAIFLLSLRHCAWRAGSQDFYVCGRKAGAGIVAFSILASCIGGSATIGMVGLAWHAGSPAFWWLGSGAIGLTILALFLAKKVRDTGAMTMPEIIDATIGPQCRALASVIILAAWMAILAAQLKAMGAIVASLAGIGMPLAVIWGAMSLLVYTALGGQQAVMKSDVWQFAILAISLLPLFAIICRNPVCLAALASAPVEITNDAFSVSRLRYFLCILGGSYIVCPMLFGRLLSARSSATARRGALWAAFGLALSGALITILGIGLRGLPLPATSQEDILIAAINISLPGWAIILATLGLFSAVISSADSCLMTAASVLANDLLKNGSVGTTRACMAVLAAAGCALAIQGQGILSLLLAANDIYVCGVVGPVFICLLAGRQTGPGRWLNAAAMCAGGALGLTAALTGVEAYSFAGVATAFMTSICGVLLERFSRKPAYGK